MATDNASLRASLAFAVSFRETGGPDVTDWKSSKVGTAYGGLVFNQAGPGLNRSILFDGVDDYLEWLATTLGSLLQFGSSSFSWEIWWKTAGATGVVSIPLHYGTYDGQDYRMQSAMIGSDATQNYVKDSVGNTADNGVLVNTDDGDWHSQLCVINRGTSKFDSWLDGTTYDSRSLGSVGALNFPGPLTVAHLVSSLPSGYWHPGNIALVRFWPTRAMDSDDAVALHNDRNGIALQTPEAAAITPATGRQGNVVTISSVAGDHYSAGLTSFLLRKDGHADIPSDSFTPSSLTDGAGQITIPVSAATGPWDLVVVVNGEESAPAIEAFEVTPVYGLTSLSRLDSGLEAMTPTSPSRLEALLGFRALIPARLDAFLDGMTATRPSRMDALNAMAVRVLSRLTSRLELTVLIPSRLDALLEVMAARPVAVRLDSLTLKGWDIWATDTATGAAVLLGFVAGDADPKELADVALADGVYEIEARPSEWFWPGARSARATTLITTPDGGGGPAITGLPVIQNLRRELVAFQSRIRWEVVQELSPMAFRFGLWFGPSSPVDTSGAPAVVVPYLAGKGAYETTRAQVATEYFAVAAFTPDQKGEVTELLMPWDLMAPNSPAAQHGDPAGP